MLTGLQPPAPDTDTDEFWRRCDQGRLAIQRCLACSAFRWPPGPACPRCASASSAWHDVSGEGTVFSWVVVRVPPVPALDGQLPYAVGLIELAEGVRIVSTIDHIAPEEITAGMPVHVHFDATTGAAAPFTFAPTATLPDGQ